jgi:UDP:flavonoid glycosyltransferase YjiC (YdhE family)
LKTLFAALPGYGHIYPVMPLAQACAAAGHELTLATGPPFLDHLPIPTVPQLSNRQDLWWGEQEVVRRFPEATGFEMIMKLFAEILPQASLARLLEQMSGSKPDLVVYEAMNVAAGMAAQLLGIPAVAFAIGLWQPFVPQLHPRAVTVHSAVWRSRGLLPPERVPLLADAYLDPIPASLQPSGLDQLPRLPIRPVAWSEDTSESLPGWLSGPRERPRIYITLGTVSFNRVDVLKRAIEETAEHDVDILVTVGPAGDPAALGPVPKAVHLERFLPQPLLLPHVDAIVHHGGTGTMLGALAAGVPQLILPQGADHFSNAAALSAVGGCRVLRNEQQLPGAIAGAVDALLHGVAEHAAAERIRDEIAAMSPPADIIPRLVELSEKGATTPPSL